MAEAHQNEYLSKPVGDMSRLKQEAGASAAEARAFINSLRGKSPEEMLGKVAASGLLRATVNSTLWTVGFLVVFTLGPYLLRSNAKAAPKPVAKPTEAAKADTTSPNKTISATDAATSPNTKAAANSGEPTEADTQRAAKAMGMDEVKQADPKKNPREKDLDSLLDAVK